MEMINIKLWQFKDLFLAVLRNNVQRLVSGIYIGRGNFATLHKTPPLRFINRAEIRQFLLLLLISSSFGEATT